MTARQDAMIRLVYGFLLIHIDLPIDSSLYVCLLLQLLLDLHIKLSEFFVVLSGTLLRNVEHVLKIV